MATTVTLGPYTLQSFEIPAVIQFGGRQRLAVHDLPGGGRVIDVLGGIDADIVFGGIISGNDADTTAQLLDALRISGLSIPLVWSEQYYIVVIADLQFEFRKSWWIPYQIRCTVQSNLVYGVGATAVDASISVLADLTSASALLPTVPTSLSAAQSAMTNSGATTYGTSAYGQSLSTLGAAQTDVQSQLASSGSALPGFDLSLSGQDPVSAAAGFNLATAGTQQVAQLSAAQGYIGQGLATLASIGT